MRGAEAILSETKIIGLLALVKSRMPKGYRVQELDQRLRMERTRLEARLLHKAKLAGVRCPTVLEVGEFEITMTKIDGKRPDMSPSECREAGQMLASLHGSDVIHGDYTPANLIKSKDGLQVIDFGLGFISNDIEDKAVDVFTMLQACAKGKEAFIDGYRDYAKAESVLKRVKVVEKRVRYAL